MTRISNIVWDEYLVLHAQSGNQQALSRLLARYQLPLMTYIVRLMGDRSEAQDILQESLLACCRQLTNLRDPARFRCWLYRIATHRCRDWQRQRYRAATKQAPLPDEDDADAGALLDRRANHYSEQLDVQDTLANLPAEDHAVLALFYLQGFSVLELAEILSITPGAVKTRLYRARARFQERWLAESATQQ